MMRISDENVVLDLDVAYLCFMEIDFGCLCFMELDFGCLCFIESHAEVMEMME